MIRDTNLTAVTAGSVKISLQICNVALFVKLKINAILNPITNKITQKVDYFALGQDVSSETLNVKIGIICIRGNRLRH